MRVIFFMEEDGKISPCPNFKPAVDIKLSEYAWNLHIVPADKAPSVVED